MKHKIPIAGVTSDSKLVKPGYAFVAIKGEKADGNHYIGEAVARGAAVIYSERDISGLPVPAIQVSSSRRALASLAAAFYDNPAEKLKLIGVTGTNGKTTATQIMFSLLQQGGYNPGLIGTLGTWIGGRCFLPGLTTPEPIELQQRLAEMVNEGANAAVMEVSSQGISQDRIWGIDFDSGVFTNISTDHIDLHSSFEKYMNAKIKFIKSISENRLVLYNSDDRYADYVYREIKGIPFSFGLNGGNARAEKTKVSSSGSEFLYCLHKSLPTRNGSVIQPFSFPVKTSILGIHNVYNLLAAITLGLHYEIPPLVMQQTLKTYAGVWRRQQILMEFPYTVIDDCTHNPGNYRSLFDTISHLKFKRLLFLAATRGNRGEEINRENGSVIGSYMRKMLDKTEVWITDCQDTAKQSDKVQTKERESLLSALRNKSVPYIYEPHLAEALTDVLHEAGEGDLVILAGAHPMDGAASLVQQLLSRQPVAGGV